MSDVLIARIRACLTDYEVTPPNNLDVDELAAELLEAVLPTYAAAEYEPTPVGWQLVDNSGVCTNCLCADCWCCVGCGGINSDCDPPGTHGYWCGL